MLVDGGFQKFFRTPTGKKKPALADELKELHAFEADLKDHLGLKSLYNEGLGTVSTLYQYDRVKDRDRGVPKPYLGVVISGPMAPPARRPPACGPARNTAARKAVATPEPRRG